MIKLMMLNRNIAILISGQVERGRGESGGNFCQFLFSLIVPSALLVALFYDPAFH